MYCQSCGAELPQSLIYCNRCGANLAPLANKVEAVVPSTKVAGAVWAISIATAMISLGGFGMILAFAINLVERGVSLSGGGMALIFFSLLVILIIAVLLIRQLSKLLVIYHWPGDAAEPKGQKPGGQPAAQIDAPREPLPSVTEHTTRTFEPLFRERDTQR